MATTTFGVNDAMAVKLWSKEVAEAERDTSDVAKLMGEDDNSIIQVKSDLGKGKGDKISFALRARLSGAGFTEGEKAEGNAEGLSFYNDSLFINELGHTVGCRSEDTIDAQRVPFNLREQGKNGLAEWWKDRKSLTVFAHACGYTPYNSSPYGVKYNGHNTITAPTSGRHIWAGSASADEGLGSSDTMVVSLIDRAKEVAMLGNTRVRPTMVGGQPKYVMYLDPSQVTSLRTSATSGGWQDITKYAYSGLNPKDHPIYNGSLGEWNGVILRQSQDITQGVNSSSGAAITTVRRAVLLGAQALACGYGKNKYGPMKYRWSEVLRDHDRELETGAWSIWGCKKTVFNSADFGTVVVSSYAVRAA